MNNIPYNPRSFLICDCADETGCWVYVDIIPLCSFSSLCSWLHYGIMFKWLICLLLYSLDTLMTLATFSLEAQLAVQLADYTVTTTQYVDVFDKTSKLLLC